MYILMVQRYMKLSRDYSDPKPIVTSSYKDRLEKLVKILKNKHPNYVFNIIGVPTIDCMDEEMYTKLNFI
jgi:hypothetical protein